MEMIFLMEAIFLNIVVALSESRFWLMPLILFCIFISLAVEIMSIVQGEIDEWPHAETRRRKDKRDLREAG